MNQEFSPATSIKTTKNHQIAFVDIRLTNYETIVAGLMPTMQVVLLDSSTNGLQTMLNALKAGDVYDEVHLFSHGSEASLQLGSSYLNVNTLNWSENQIALDQIGAVLNADGKFFIYACDLAKGVGGLSFVESLAQLTHLNVSASNNATGASQLGGDWNLEVTADANGHLIHDALLSTAAPLAAQLQSYDALLAGVISASANITVATGNDYLSATPGTTPLNVQGAVELSNGTRVVLLANTHADYYGMANLDYLQIASVDTLGNVSTIALSGTVADVINNNGGNTHDSSFTQTNDAANLVALTNGFVVTSYSNDGYGVQMYNNSGVSQNISAPATYTSSVNPNAFAIATADGGFILLWTKNNYQELDFQRYNSSGTKVGTTIATAFSNTTPNIQGAAVDANGNLAIPVSTNDVYTHSQVMLWNSSNSLIGTYDTAFYQTSPVVTAMYGGGFDLFGNDIGSGVGNTAGSYYVQSLAADGSLSLVISTVVPVAYLKTVALSLSGDYFVVGGADSSIFDGYSVSGFNPSAGTTSRIVNDPAKLVVAPSLAADGDVTGAWATGTTTQENGFITDGTIATVTYSAAFASAADMPPTIAGNYVNNGSVNDNATATPFTGISVSDTDSVIGSLTITYNAANGTLTGTGLTGVAGNYVLNTGGTAFATLSSNLHTLVFHPTTNQVIPGASVLTTFTLTPSDGIRTGRANTFTNEAALSINDAPVIDSNGGGASASINPDENQTTVTTVHATDPDVSPTITYSKSGTDAALFNLNTSTGQLTFITAPNFEAPGDANHDNVYDVTVTASDGSLTDSQVLSITVQNVNEAPVISSNGGGANASISVTENQSAVTTVIASDVDAATTLTYSISGTDSALFDINNSTGVLTFKNAPNFEAPTDSGTNNIYNLTVTASDGSLTDTQTVAITVTNLNEAPVISSDGGGSSASISVAENQSAVTTVVASDVDAATTLTYSVSGTDAALFDINSSTGVVTFKNAPNFESPADSDGNNVYDLIVTASDGALTDTQAIAITVTNVNEAPVISSNGGGASASVSVSENQSAVTTVVASDVDASATLSYSVSGTDAALFDINSTTGVLTFKNAPNFESPADSGGNNIYDLIVTASDGSLSDTQAIAITVTNVNEAPVISGLTAADNQSVSASGNAVLIDQGTSATVSDVDNANFNNGTLTIALASGRASGDALSIRSGVGVTLSDGTNVASNISVGGQIIGSIASNGTGSGTDNLILNLNAQATPARVSTLLQNLTFDATGTQGDRILNVTLNDGGVDSNVASLTLSVTTNPTVEITSTSNTFKAGESATITFTFSEAPVGFSNADITLTGGALSTVTVNGVNNKIYTATFTPTVDTQSLTGAISVAANTFTNSANEDNLASVVNVTISGDTLQPSIATITRQTPNVASTNASSVSYAISFNENVTGVDVSDFSLMQTGSATGSISGVTGSGSSYVVTVNGVSGDGTLRLDLNSANTNILDAATNPVAGGYSSGQIFTIDQPAIHTANYDASTGILVVTGKGMVSGDTIVVNKLSLTGDNGNSYTLSSNDVTASSATSFSVSLNAADKLAINGLLNKNGLTSVDGSSFNLAAAINWDNTIGSGADTIGNAVTVANVQTPLINSAGYNASTHVLSVSGSHLVGILGVNNDITVSKLSLKGEGGTTYTLTSNNVEVTDANNFSVTLNATDSAVIETIFNKNGSSSTGGTNYNLAATDDWNSVIGNTNIAVTTAAVSVSNVPVPTITSSTYDAATGVVVVTGTGFTKFVGNTNDIDITKLNIRGEGGSLYAPSHTADVEITSPTSFSFSLDTADKEVFNSIINKNGTAATGGANYTLTPADNFLRGADSAINIAGNAVTMTVSNVPVPSINAADYNVVTGVLTVTGSGFSRLNGSYNDILANHLTFTGHSNATYRLTDTTNVDMVSTTSFTMTLSATDRAALALIINKNGVSAGSGTVYNLAADEDWNAAADTAVVIADLFNNGITVTGVAPTTSIVTSSFSVDSGIAANDFITNTAAQTISGTLSANLLSGESIEVSVNDGTFWSTASATVGQNTWSLAGVNLANGTSNLKVRVVDTYSNSGPVYTQSYTLDSTAPSGTINSVHFSSDSGISSTDFVTNSASQSISGTLSAAMLSDEVLQVSLDNGAHWSTATTTVGLNTWTLAGQTLTGDNTLKVRSIDTAGNTGTVSSQVYKFDTTAPALASAITISDTSLKISETATVSFHFTEPVNGFTTADLTVENGTVTGLSSADGGLNWTATLTAQANISDSSNVITLDLTGLSDVAGNSGTGNTNSPNYAIDTIRPTLSSAITLSDTALKIGDTANVGFAFNEAVTSFTTADVQVANGILSNLSSSDGGVHWTATLTPTANIEDATNILTLDLSGLQDLAGNAGSGSVNSANYAVETRAPTANITVSDDNLIIGDTSLVTITFSEAVTGLTNADLTIPNGTLSPISSSNGGLTWTATYTPTFGIANNTNVITLDATGINDAAGNTGTGIVNSPNFVLNTVNTVPTISGIIGNQNTLATATVSPFSSIVITDPDFGAAETITVSLDNATKGVFTAASLSASGFATADGGLTYSHAVTTPANIQAALRALVFQPALGRVAVGQTDSTTFTVSVNDSYAVTTDNNTHVNATAVNLAPTGISISSSTVNQTAGGYATVGNLSTVDINPGDVHHYTLVESADNSDLFDIQDNHLRIINPAGVEAGDYPVTIRTTDAGGLSVEQSLMIAVRDTMAPTLVDFSVAEDPTLSSRIFYTLRFSESVTGVDLSDFKLSKTGSINGTIESVTRIDLTGYLVVVTGISGVGNLQLGLLPQHGIKDVVGRSLLGTPSGPVYSKDNDLDLVSDYIESQVPNRTGQGTGDGNGDGIQDRLQNDVSSVLLADQSQHPTYLTVWNSAQLSQSNVAVSKNNLSSNINFPYGWLSLNFEGIAVGGSTAVSLLINDTKPINGYWKKDVNGKLVNIADSITTSGNNTLITFTLTDGDRFDLDGLANGRIVDPGAPGFLQSTVLSLDTAGLTTVTPRNAESLSFKVTFSDAVSHVDISDFKLLKSGNANGMISGVEKLFDNTYVVVVNQLSGNGSLALDLNKTANDIVSISGAFIGTVDISAPHIIESQIGVRSNSEKIAALYTLMYHRAPDESGLNYWLNEMAHGKTMTDISRAFAGNARFLTDYASMSNQQFVETMYQQGLGNQGDASGIGYWTGKLNLGQSRPDMLAEFALASITADLVAAHKTHVLTDAEYLAASVRQNALLNRIDVGLEFVQKFGINSNPQAASDLDPAYYAAKLLLTKVDATDETLETALHTLQVAHTINDIQIMAAHPLDISLIGLQTEAVTTSFQI